MLFIDIENQKHFSNLLSPCKIHYFFSLQIAEERTRIEAKYSKYKNEHKCNKLSSDDPKFENNESRVSTKVDACHTQTHQTLNTNKRKVSLKSVKSEHAGVIASSQLNRLVGDAASSKTARKPGQVHVKSSKYTPAHTKAPFKTLPEVKRPISSKSASADKVKHVKVTDKNLAKLNENNQLQEVRCVKETEASSHSLKDVDELNKKLDELSVKEYTGKEESQSPAEEEGFCLLTEG